MDNKSHAEIGVFLGGGGGKGAQQAVVLDRVGERLLDRPLPNAEGEFRGLINGLRAHGPVLLVVDQSATVGALVVAVAHAEGVSVGRHHDGDTASYHPTYSSDHRPKEDRGAPTEPDSRGCRPSCNRGLPPAAG